MDQPSKVANPARGQLPRTCLRIWSRDTVSAVPSRVSLLISIILSQAESGAYLRDSSRVPRRRPFIYIKAPCAIGSDPSVSGHADQLICASLSHTHYWYKVGMLKVPAVDDLAFCFNFNFQRPVKRKIWRTVQYSTYSSQIID